MVVTDGEPEVDAGSAVSARANKRSAYYFYLAPLIAAPILILVFAVLIVPTNWFAEHSGDPFLVTLGYGATLRNADCRVAIFGDSTAMIGVNPSVVEKRTGLSTCNIAETEGMTMINGTMVLDQFLEHNPRPQFIVLLYSPEDLDPQSQRRNVNVTTFEAVTYRFRQPNKLMSIIALMRHPEDFFSWAIHGARWAINSIHAKPLSPETKLLRVKTHGQSAIKDPPMTSCTAVPQTSPPDRDWVNGLRSKYGVDNTTVLVDAMLMADCDPGLGYYQRELAGVIDNRLDPLPMTDYYVGGRHVNPAGSVPLSSMIANQILERLHADPARGAR